MYCAEPATRAWFEFVACSTVSIASTYHAVMSFEPTGLRWLFISPGDDSRKSYTDSATETEDNERCIVLNTPGSTSFGVRAAYAVIRHILLVDRYFGEIGYISRSLPKRNNASTHYQQNRVEP